MSGTLAVLILAVDEEREFVGRILVESGAEISYELGDVERASYVVVDPAALPDYETLVRDLRGPLVVVIADDSDGILRALRCGAGEVLLRPFTADEEMVRRVFQPRRALLATPRVPDSVHFSVTTPPKAAPGTKILVDVWAHLGAQRQEVAERAKEAAAGAGVQMRSANPAEVTRGAVLAVELRVEEAEVDPPREKIVWTGEIANASFVVSLSGTTVQRSATARVFAEGLEIARVRFLLDAGPVSVEASHHRKAFASYAHADREEVLARIQGMQKTPGLEVFLDVLSLRSGQDWQERLWRVIPENDVFYLFWSRAAAKSTWVEAEWKCALSSRGAGFIDPVPLCGPEAAPPPEELAAKHFDDWTLAFGRQSRPPRTSLFVRLFGAR